MTDLVFAQLPVGEMANLAYLIGSRASGEALLVDPAWEVDALLDRAAAEDLRVAGVLVTHYHPDHVGGGLFGHEIEGLARLMERAPAPVHVHEAEAEGLRRVTGLSAGDLVPHQSGDTLALGDALRVRLLHTPGHTPGSQCFLLEEAGAPGRLVSGDTLFLGSCGRVDLPGSDPEAMHRSLRQLAELPDETLLFPGHRYSAEPHSSLGEQKRSNPYLRATRLADFLAFTGG